MTPEELKSKWNSLKGATRSAADPDYLDAIVSDRMMTAREKLSSRYRRLTCVGAAMTVLMVASYFLGHGPFSFMHHVALEFAAFFLFCGAVDFILYRRVEGLDICTMNLGEIVTRSRRLRLIHLISMVVTAPLAALVLYQLYQICDTYERWGMLIGGIVGLGFGLNLFIQTLRDYRTLTSDPA